MVKRLSPVVAGGGAILVVVISVVAVLVGGEASLDPLSATISEYAAAGGGTVRWALGALGLASLALVAGLRAVGAPIDGWPARLLCVWSWALIALVAVSGVRAGFGWDSGWGSEVDRAVSLAAFVSVPAAAAQLVGRFEGDERWRGIARPLEWLALAAGLGLATLTYVALPGHGVMIGLVERLLFAIELAILALLAGRLLRQHDRMAEALAARAASAGRGGRAPQGPIFARRSAS